MNVFLLTDLEGLIGVTDMDYVDRTGEKYQLARRYLTDTINHTVRLCRNHGAERVYVLDGHGGGGNVIAEDLIPEAEQVDIVGWQELIRSGKIDCQIEVGGHARAESTIRRFSFENRVNVVNPILLRASSLRKEKWLWHTAIQTASNVP